MEEYSTALPGNEASYQCDKPSPGKVINMRAFLLYSHLLMVPVHKHLADTLVVSQEPGCPGDGRSSWRIPQVQLSLALFALGSLPRF